MGEIRLTPAQQAVVDGYRSYEKRTGYFCMD